MGRRSVITAVNAQNLPAVKWHYHMGFKEIGRKIETLYIFGRPSQQLYHLCARGRRAPGFLVTLISIEIETRAEALDLIDRNELVWQPGAEVDPIFGGHAWLKAWWRSLALPADRLRVMVLRKDTQPVGAAFLYLSRQRWGPLFLQELRPVGWSVSEYLGLHLPPESAAVHAHVRNLGRPEGMERFFLDPATQGLWLAAAGNRRGQSTRLAMAGRT